MKNEATEEFDENCTNCRHFNQYRQSEDHGLGAVEYRTYSVCEIYGTEVSEDNLCAEYYETKEGVQA